MATTHSHTTIERTVTGLDYELVDVQHGTLVTLRLRLPEAQAAAFVQRINDIGQGRVGWEDATG